MRPQKHLDILTYVSVVLSPFEDNEYFLAFDNGTLCYQSEAFGGIASRP
jgi:hypothetical protein